MIETKIPNHPDPIKQARIELLSNWPDEDWSFNLQDEFEDLREEAKCLVAYLKVFLISFEGRPRGSIGELSRFTMHISATDASAAVLKLYDGYDDVTKFTCEEVSK